MPSLKYFPHDEAVRELAEPFVKIPVNPPLQTGDDNVFSPLVKGSQRGFFQNFDSIGVQRYPLIH